MKSETLVLAEALADEQLKSWPVETQAVLRLGIRNDLMVPAIERALLLEREECAKVADDLSEIYDGRAISNAIRARGGK